MSWALIIAVHYLLIQFLCHVEAEADTVDEAGLLVQATEAAAGVDDLVFSLEGFRRS